MSNDREFSETGCAMTSLSLLAAARSQDQQAWQRIARLYQPLIEDWCRQSQVPATDAADIIQEVLAAVWKNLGEFRKANPGDSFRGWLKAITRNKIHDHFRKRKHQGIAVGGSTAQLRFQELPELLPESDSEVATGEERQVLLRALEMIRGEFEPKTWAAFWMTVVDGQLPTETATELAVSAGAVRQSKYKVLRRLRSELGDLVPGPSLNS